MGHVYLAHDEVLGRDVALKVLKEPYADDEEFVERFRREARNAAALSHPNIVPVYDGGEAEDGTPYIAMEHMAGGTLGELLAREGAFGVPKAAAVAIEIARALREAHDHGVIHRDVNPHNVFLAGPSASLSVEPEGIPLGAVKVGDFGIARAAEASTMTESNLILGTPRYLSPEQAKGDPVSPKSDLYSLGVVLYQMLTGRVPFDAEDAISITTKHVSEPPPSPKEANPEVPEDVSALVLRLLSKDPEDRYGDAAELIGDLKRVRDGLPPALLSANPMGVLGGRGEAKGVAAPTIHGDQDGKLRRSWKEKADTLSAAVVYGGGEKRRRISPWLPAAVASVAILVMLLGVVGSSLLRGYTEQAAIASLQDPAQDPADDPGETSEETEPVASEGGSVGEMPEETEPAAGGGGGVDEEGVKEEEAKVRPADIPSQVKAAIYNVSPGDVNEESSGLEHFVAAPAAPIIRGGTTTPEDAAPQAPQATPKPPTPEAVREAPTPTEDLDAPAPKENLKTPSSREPGKHMAVATIKSPKIKGAEEPATKKAKTKKAKSKREEPEKK